MNVQDFVKGINLGLDEGSRMDCPVCGGTNTFSISKTLSGMKWNCYSSSCNIKGVDSNIKLSPEEIREALTHTSSNKYQPYPAPEEWVSPLGHTPVMHYLDKNNCMSAFKDRRVDVHYDVIRSRIVFLNWVKGICIGAVGRKDTMHVAGPKWLVYGAALSHPLVVPQYGSYGFPDHPTGRRIGIIVEDAASACAASCVGDGIALMGTHLVPEFIPILKGYDKIIVALDPDAARKSIDMANYLKFFVDTKVVLLKDDLKYSKVDEICDIFATHVN